MSKKRERSFQKSWKYLLSRLPTHSPSCTLEKARKVFAKKIIGKRKSCPVCRKSGYINPFQLNKNLLRTLIYMTGRCGPSGQKYISMKSEDLPKGSRAKDYSKLAYWGFIKKRGDAGKKTPSSGYWKVTDKGRRFASHQEKAPKMVFVYDQEVIDSSDEEIWCTQVEGYNYWKESKNTWMGKIARRKRHKRRRGKNEDDPNR